MTRIARTACATKVCAWGGAAVLALAPALLLSGAAWAAEEGAQPWPWQTNFQAAASPTMERIAALAATLDIITFAIFFFVAGLVGYVCWRFRASRNPVPATWTHNTKLEVVWTIAPVLILVLIAFPSFRLLYFMDRTQEADMTLKITGHQWYWSYEYPEHGIAFDALMLDDSQRTPDQPRLLATDNKVVLPVGVPVRLHMAADDVIHAWAVPALGVKTDNVPGRLNESWVRIDKPGTYYGQCSELCGVNHAFMPITIEAVPPERFQAWLGEARQKFAKAGAGTVTPQEAASPPAKEADETPSPGPAPRTDVPARPGDIPDQPQGVPTPDSAPPAAGATQNQ